LPYTFFNELSHQDTYTIYRHILGLLTTQTTSAISLNTSLDFLKSHYVEMLLSEFVDVKLILELQETSPLHSIFQIENRLNDIKEHPRDLYEDDKNLLKYLIKMIKRKANMIVIEGVDSFDKYIFCKEQQCLMQGYFFNEIKNSAFC
jgi:hypothetical protein